MTNGGPGTSTLVLYQYTWMNAFKYYEMGYASAIGYFMGGGYPGLVMYQSLHQQDKG